jgi:protein SCO1/2
MTRRVSLLVTVLLAATGSAEEKPPRPVDAVFEARLGAKVPLDLPFVDSGGHPVTLRDCLRPKRPAILVLAYYRCPTLCNVLLAGLNAGLRDLAREREFVVGDQFDVVVVSIDPREGTDVAAGQKTSHVERYGIPGTEKGWHFLTGQEKEIRALADEVGFGYQFDAKTGQYAHGSGLLTLTPEGVVSRAIYDVSFKSPDAGFKSRDLYYALVEASEFRVGKGLADRVSVLFCYSYDPTHGTYRSLGVINLVRVFGVLTMLGMGLTFVLLRRKEKRRQARREEVAA